MRSTECTSTTNIIFHSASFFLHNRRCRRHRRLSRPFLLCRVIDNPSGLYRLAYIFFVFVITSFADRAGDAVGEWNFHRQILTSNAHLHSFIHRFFFYSLPPSLTSFFQPLHFFNSTLNQPDQHSLHHPSILSSVQEYPIHLELSSGRICTRRWSDQAQGGRTS